MRVVFLSDTHGRHTEMDIPEGDVIIHGGDMTDKGTTKEAIRFLHWFESLPHFYKVAIPGNHDLCFNPNLKMGNEEFRRAVQNFTSLRDLNMILYDQMCEIEGFRIWGSPYTPAYGSKWTFGIERGQPMRTHWSQIPATVDILVTHGPPKDILDTYYWNEESERIGCEGLKEAVLAKRPRLHLFGHVHDSRGVTAEDSITFINGSIIRDDCDSLNPCWVIDIDQNHIRVYEDGSEFAGVPF